VAAGRVSLRLRSIAVTPWYSCPRFRDKVQKGFC